MLFRTPKPLTTSPYAGFVTRFCAFIIDVTVIALIAGGIGWAAHAPHWDQRHSVASFILVWLYYALLESSRLQATLGKLCLRYRVCDLYGGRISFARATARHLAIALSVLPFGLGFLLVLISERKQALHDMIAGCVHVFR